MKEDTSIHTSEIQKPRWQSRGGSGSAGKPRGTYVLCLSNWIAFQAVASNGPITVADGGGAYMAPEISLLGGIRETHTLFFPINKKGPSCARRHCHLVFLFQLLPGLRI